MASFVNEEVAKKMGRADKERLEQYKDHDEEITKMAEPKKGFKLQATQGFHFFIKDGAEFSQYLIRATWSGSLSEAGRKLEFEIAYTTKDDKFTNFQIEVGNRVQMKYIDDNGNEFILFEGRVFFRDRDSSTYSMSFIAFDNLIYLAKSEMQYKFSNMTADAVVKTVCAALGVTVGTLHDDLSKLNCDFIADPMTGTEIINRALGLGKKYTSTGWRYKMVMIDNGSGQQVLNVVRADEIVENFKITDTTNQISATHGESIEDMVNQIQIVNDAGDPTGYIKLEDDIKQYGMIQKVYKYNSKEKTEDAAKLLLQKKKEHSELHALGNVQCISGYAVEVQEEQIVGKFMIMSDNHKIENGQHYMDLTLDYIVEPDSRTGATTEGNVNPAPTKNPKGGNARKSSKVGVQDGIQAFKGTKTSVTKASTGISSHYSKFGAEEYNQDVGNVATLVNDAQKAGLYQKVGSGSTIEPGDILIYGNNEYAVIATGGQRYAGTNVKSGKVVEGNDFTSAWHEGVYPNAIIKTSRG